MPASFRRRSGWIIVSCFVVIGAVAANGVFPVCGTDTPDLPLPAPLPDVKHPDDNLPTSEKIALGRALFSDPRLSRTGKLSCASCHDPAKGFSNGEPVAIGVNGRKGTRNVPTLVNAAFSKFQFWDGRAATLEDQALFPIQNALEMDMPLDLLEKRLAEIPDYRRQFQQVFAGEITARRVAQAIAAFERTLVSRDTPFDRYLKGDRQALSPAAQRGMKLFYEQARCFLCHQGPNFTDDDFHNVGIVDNDLGRRGVTGKLADHGKFKTPTLREIARTAPYMHDGRFKTLHEVVQHYNFGGVSDQDNPHRDEKLQVLYLVESQVDDLVEFLREGLTSRPPVGLAR